MMSRMFVPNACFMVFVAFTLVGLGINAQQPCRPFERQTTNLREVIIGACEYYQQTINQPVFCTPPGFRNCTLIWENFYNAFSYQPRCNVSESRYSDYINVTGHPIPVDKAMFWENTFPFVQRFSNNGAKYTTISDTMTGYIGNVAQWCSDPNTSDGIAADNTLCPGWEATSSCHQGAVRAFWIAASKHFGLTSRGEIFIMLNASVTPIYAETTYLAVYEMPYLTTGVVTKATVILMNEQPVRGMTKCNDPSLTILSKELSHKNIRYECVENRRDAADLYCLDFPSSPMCSILHDTSTASRVPVTSWITLLLVLCLSITVILTGNR